MMILLSFSIGDKAVEGALFDMKLLKTERIKTNGSGEGIVSCF